MSFLNFIIIVLGSIPCAVGYSVLSGFQPFGPGDAVLDLLDFLVSNVIMPLGSLVFLFFCTRRLGWGWKKFMTELMPVRACIFLKKPNFTLVGFSPLIVIFIFLFGLWEKRIRIKIIMGNSCICCFFDVVKVRYFFVKTN